VIVSVNPATRPGSILSTCVGTWQRPIPGRAAWSRTLDAVGGDRSADGDHDNFFGAAHVATGTIHHKIVNYNILAFAFLIFSAGHRFFNIPSRCAIRLAQIHLGG
jgi:hypothetical protein